MEAAQKIRILHVRVGELPEVVEIEHRLEEMQRLVGGYIECVGLFDGVDLWCNDEALLVAEPQINRWVPGFRQPIFGDFFLARHDGEGNSTSLTDEDVARYMEAFA